MESLRQILSPDFLLRNSVYTSVLIGFACPLVGVFLVLRRLIFMGVALPQISSTGVAVGAFAAAQVHDLSVTIGSKAPRPRRWRNLRQPRRP